MAVAKETFESLQAVLAHRQNWLDDVYAGLLINGVKRSEIVVHQMPDLTLYVWVRGVFKYKWRMRDATDG